MSTRRLKFLIVLAAVFAAAAISFAGCKLGATKEEILNTNKITSGVVYYANGGRFSYNSEKNVWDIYYRANTPVIDIRETEGPDNARVSYSNHTLDGWYYAELDKNGNPVFTDADGKTLYLHVFADGEASADESKTAFENENGEVVYKTYEEVSAKASENKFDFSKRIGANETLYLVAKWMSDAKLEYVLVSENGQPVKLIGAGGTVTEYADGSVIKEEWFDNKFSSNVSSAEPGTAENATFLMNYADEQCTIPATNVQIPEGGENVRVYSKFISGVWRVVKTPSDVSGMFTSSGLGLASRQYYIFDDIDCSSVSLSANSGELKCTINGNGHVLKNLKFNSGSIAAAANVSAFGKIASSAKINDITFENVSVTLETKNNITVEGLYLVCGGIEAGAQLKNVSFKNVLLTFSDAQQKSEIQNLPRSGVDANGELAVYGTDNWIFGGEDTDGAFIQKYGVTLNGYELRLIIDNLKKTTRTLFSAGYAE